MIGRQVLLTRVGFSKSIAVELAAAACKTLYPTVGRQRRAVLIIPCIHKH